MVRFIFWKGNMEIEGSKEAYDHDHELVTGTFYCPNENPGTIIMMSFKKWPKDGIYHFAYRVGQSVVCERMVAERLKLKGMFHYDKV